MTLQEEIDINTNAPHLLSLRQIAAWQVGGIENGCSEIIAKVPSLQRGAACEPQQTEMLLDSDHARLMVTAR